MSSSSTVLIADDDPDVLELLKVFLRSLDTNVITARDGEEALELARRELPAVALLDVQMPKRSGWDVCQALKSVERTAGIGIVLITGRGEVKDRLTGLQVGADDYLVKPIHRGEVVKRVGDLLSRRRKPRTQADEVPSSEGAAAPVVRTTLIDPATSLPPIAAVIDRLKERLIEQGEMGIIHIDIESFETIETDYGWAFFDEFLRKIGEILTAEVSQNLPGGATVTVSRVAGSSFYVFVDTRTGKLKQESLEEMADAIRQRLVKKMRERFPKVDSSQIAFYAGAVCMQYETQLRLERQIYAGMQKSVDAVRTAEHSRRRQLSRELREIIRRKEVTSLFQPIVRSVDGSIFGFEVLTRGPANSSFRNSDMLFSFARENRLGWDLEALALDSCLARLKSIEIGDRKFLVNLEAEMFESSELRFHEMVNYFSEHKGSFVFELTERAAIEDYARFRVLLDDFRSRGIDIAIDDAGSGYASLEAIAALAPDYLKVTKGLISTLAVEPIKQDLVTMLVELAHKIGAQTIAEGIETAEEYAWCKQLGIDLMQGYYIARPQKEVRDEIDDLVEASE
ncbi:MAG: EAL domain-containing protein [Acidobacteriota bacterium]